MVDYVAVQQGDLDDAATINTVVGHENLADYVAYGLSISADFTTTPATVSLTEGKVFVLLPIQDAPGVGHEKHDCLVTAHYDSRQADLITGGVNYLWARFNLGTRDSPKIDVTEVNTPPTPDSVLIGTVDATNEVVEELNRDPDGNYESLAVEDLDVGTQITWPDGETTTEHPLTYGESINNYNAYYDVEEGDPPGTVAEAAYAEEAGHATTADQADRASSAYDADHLDGHTLGYILDQASQETSYEWEPILDEPYRWTNTSRSIDKTFYFRNPYDRYKVALQVDNYNPWIDALYMQLNGITSEKYRTIDLEAAEYLDSPEKYNEIRYQRRKNWIIGDTMANSHSIHEFYLACPRPVKGRGNGPNCRFPVFNTGQHQTGTIRTYHIAGNLAKGVDMIDKLRIFSDHEGTAMEIQIYGKNGF